MAGYVSYIGGPRRADHEDGPEAFHLVVLDNGRSRILGDPRFREILCCIRCAACLNVCPVYGEIGGHAYGFAYSGPVGAVVTPLLAGVRRARHLCFGETLCGACRQICPVDIDIPRMLLELRAVLAEGDRRWGTAPVSAAGTAAWHLWSLAVRHPRLYDMAVRAAAAAQCLLPRNGDFLRHVPPPLSGWTRSRDLRPLVPGSFVRGRHRR
jgi:L-lactate dehydrogenase complex protein LldF